MGRKMHLRLSRRLIVNQWQVKLTSTQKNDPVLIVDSAVSAFAARKAARRPTREVTSQNGVQTSLVAEISNDPLEEPKPPRKKQKRSNESRDKSPRQPQQTDDLVDLRDRSIEDGTKAIANDSESDSFSDTEPDALARSTAPVRRLSTFDLSRSKLLSETETEWTVRLHFNDVST